jgi:cytochrome c oxidase assembly protein subunit 15
MYNETGAPETAWLQNPTLSFYHPFISTLLTNVFTILNKKLVIGFTKLKWVLYILVIEITGMASIVYFLLNSNHSYRSRYNLIWYSILFNF